MVSIWTLLASVLGSVMASSGFWAFLTAKAQNKSAMAQMLKGIGHDRICYLGEKYILRGYISRDEFENLHDYLYVPYRRLGGNGTAEKVMNDVKKLPFREN